MKFLYEYRTRDNAKHTGVITAPDREAAFAALKAQGIRPGFMQEAPGFFNKLFGKGKRWLAIAILALLCAALAVAVARLRHGSSRSAALDSSLDASVRRQLIGDAAVIEKGIHTGWSDVFSDEGDRFLASFAIPGISPAVRTTSEDALARALAAPTSSPLDPRTLSIEARQIVAIVNGMKEEIRDLLKSGWSYREVGAALVKRQERERGYYQLALKEVEAAKERNLPDDEWFSLWEKKNNELRNLGIKLIPLPE